ncbi:MAG: decaprenyl-phosphate phosphoribosyltransferase [Deltaproteobacteria bacterium]|nr:decaprenyl-phosphate phosphoribosyltransferase [Deltaproteobacteria bacterium]
MTPPAAVVRLSPWAVLRTARPHQWIKNLFVAAPLVFAQRVGDEGALWRCIAAVACFCILSSSVYFLNDIVDVEKDRAHPTKRRRPIASGALPMATARALVAGFSVSALMGAVLVSPWFATVATAYFVLNIAYSLRLKNIAFVDVVCIAAGFLLRVLGGAHAIAVPPSLWLLVCTLLLASMLGFGKRAHELRVAGDRGLTREVLERYQMSTLRPLLVVLAILTVAAYSSYTQSAHALEFFGTRALAFTIPFVVIGIARFLSMVLNQKDAESPTDSMLRDKLFLANLFVYGAAILIIIYRA